MRLATDMENTILNALAQKMARHLVRWLDDIPATVLCPVTITAGTQGTMTQFVIERADRQTMAIYVVEYPNWEIHISETPTTWIGENNRVREASHVGEITIHYRALVPTSRNAPCEWVRFDHRYND